MFERLKKAIKKNDKLYVMARCIKNINDPEYVQLVRGYYEPYYGDASSALIYHYGDKEPNKIIVGICPSDYNCGFCALLTQTLYSLNFADNINAIPSVYWSKDTLYYELEFDSETDNVFEYYFQPVSDIKFRYIDSYRNVIKILGQHNYFNGLDYGYDGTFQREYVFPRLAYLYKKYVRLNYRTNKYISEQKAKLFDETDRVIGVHVRGTDFGVGLIGHPKKIQPSEHIREVKELLKLGKYNKIFLATEDLNAIDQFKKEFSDNLVYYSDTFRTKNDRGPHCTPNDRSLHHYRLGLEVLRDVYTLANCDALVCGLSNVSLAARYINLALDKKFDKVIVLNNGINEEDSRAAKILSRENKKRIEEYKHDLHQNP